jgi:hypothetical protein
MKDNHIPIRNQRFGVGLSLALLVLIMACAPGTVPIAPPAAEGPSAPPELLDSFAVADLRPGQTWQIFLEGSDPNGDMKDIWFVASQIGGTVWVNQFVVLQGENRRRFMGYVELPTPLSLYRSSTGWETVRVEVRIRDGAGQYSQARIHEVVIGKYTAEAVPAKWRPAFQHKLGTIFLDFDLDREPNQPRLRR